MEEHATDLVPLLLGLISFLLGSMLWFSKSFINRLFKKIDELEKVFHSGMDDRRKQEGFIYDRVNALDSRVVSIETKCDLFHGKAKVLG